MQQQRSPEKRTQEQEPQAHPAHEAGKTAVAETTSVEDIDALLAEIDETLEESDTTDLENTLDEIDSMMEGINAEEMISSYKQKGGQ